MDVQIRKIAWGAPKKIIAYHSTKVGGWSNGVFEFSNMSLDVGDNPKDVKKVSKYFSSDFKPYVIGKISKGNNKVTLNGSINWS